MKTRFENKLKGFSPITLTELNSTASFLKRIEKKYLLKEEQFSEMIEDLEKDFQILEIAGTKVFTYDNVYMDTKDYLFYNQHQNKQKSRTKIRTRYYVDSNLAFFEYKQKNKGVTSKYRYQFPPEEHGFMTKGKKRFFDGVWQSMYDQEKVPKIMPSIKTNYKRITMVSKTGEERLTIDFNVKATDLRKKGAKVVDLKNLIIIESKSLKKDCKAFDIMKKYNISKASSCSKYSLGVVYSGIAEKYDTFASTMEKIKKIRLETIKNVNRTTSLSTVTKNISKSLIKKEATC